MENSEKQIKGKYRKESTALDAATECLKLYYSISTIKRNEWRFKKAVNIAKKQLKENGEVDIKGAQWGGKWGNFYKRVALNSKGEYEYVAAFNTNKALGF